MQVRQKKDKIQRTPPENLSDYFFGKVPPQANDLEQTVLGAVMLEKDALVEVMDTLRPESFYDTAHQLIFTAVLELFEKSHPVDMLTVTEQLRKNGQLENAGGVHYLMELTSRVASAANVLYHAHIVKEKFMKRELINMSSRIISRAYEETEDVFDMVDKAEQHLYGIVRNTLSGKVVPAHRLAMDAIDQMNKAIDKKGDLTGVGSSFTELDQTTGGWQKSDLIIIAGRPSMGKTAFVLSCARNAAIDFKKPVAIFSLEMSAIQLMNRLLGAEAQVEINKITSGDLTPFEINEIHEKAGIIREAPLFIDDTAGLNILELRAKCRRLKAQYGVELFIIDYLQLMSGVEDNRKVTNRENEISNISRNLKKLAKELNTPIIALSQLSREVEKRNDKQPKLSDLRESGAIEQDADMVIFIHRPEYYGIKETGHGTTTRGLAEIIIAKHRNGGLGLIETKFINAFAKFVEMDSKIIER